MAGLRYGFHTGVNPDRTLARARANMASARQNASVVEKYIAEEVALGNILGPFPPALLQGVQINTFKRSISQASGV